MTASIASREFEFAMRVFDATTEEHEELMGIGMVGVVEANSNDETINVNVFPSVRIAKQWVAAMEYATDYETGSAFYIVGADIPV